VRKHRRTLKTSSTQLVSNFNAAVAGRLVSNQLLALSGLPRASSDEE